MFLKLHPTSNQELYDDIIDSSVCERIYGRNISIIDFGKIIDIAILRNSTALLEMIEQFIRKYQLVKCKVKIQREWEFSYDLFNMR